MKSKKKIIGITIVLLLLVAAGICAYLYFGTETFKSPEELFYKYLGKMSENESSYQARLDEVKKIETKSYKSDASIGVEVKTKGTDYNSKIQQVAFDEVSKLKLEVQTQNVPSQKKASSNIALKYNDENITELKLLKDEDKFGVQSEFLDEKYVAIENKNLKSLMRKLGQDSAGVPDQIESIDVFDLFYIGKEDQERIINDYKEVIKNNISSDKFKKNDNVVKKINGEEKTTTELSLSLNERELYDLLINILEKVQNDDALLNILVEKTNKINGMSIGTNYITIEGNMTKELASKKISDIIVMLKNKKDQITETKGFTISLYVVNDEVARIEFKVNDETKFAIDINNNKDKKHMDIYIAEYIDQKGNPTELIKIIEIEYNSIRNGDETKVEGNIILHIANDVKVGFEIDKQGKLEDKNSKVNAKFVIGTETMEFTINVDSNIEMTENISIESLNEKNAMVLNDMSKNEIDEFFNKVQENLQEKIMEKLKGLGLVSSSTIIGPQNIKINF